MASEFGFFQARFSTALLWSTVLATALIVTASPARAEVVTLVCQNESGLSMTIRVDYNRKIVDLLNSDGTVQLSAQAKITEGKVGWSNGDTPNSNGEYRFEGHLNRLSGQGLITYLTDRRGSGAWELSGVAGPCRRATQKF